MSVKFDKETFHSTAAAVDAASKGNDDLMHEIGQAITKGGGPNGYLAVSLARPDTLRRLLQLTVRAPGLPQAAAEQPIAHQDAHLGYPLRPAGVPRLVDCP